MKSFVSWRISEEPITLRSTTTNWMATESSTPCHETSLRLLTLRSSVSWHTLEKSMPLHLTIKRSSNSYFLPEIQHIFFPRTLCIFATQQYLITHAENVYPSISKVQIFIITTDVMISHKDELPKHEVYCTKICSGPDMTLFIFDKGPISEQILCGISSPEKHTSFFSLLLFYLHSNIVHFTTFSTALIKH